MDNFCDVSVQVLLSKCIPDEVRLFLSETTTNEQETPQEN